MMTYDPFRNRMDDDEDMPRGYKMMFAKRCRDQEHVEISPYDESDMYEVAMLIDERVEEDIRKSCDMYSNFLWYVFEGTEKELAEMRKAIRRLSRGKPRFTFVFEGYHD